VKTLGEREREREGGVKRSELEKDGKGGEKRDKEVYFCVCALHQCPSGIHKWECFIST